MVCLSAASFGNSSAYSCPAMFTGDGVQTNMMDNSLVSRDVLVYLLAVQYVVVSQTIAPEGVTQNRKEQMHDSCSHKFVSVS